MIENIRLTTMNYELMLVVSPEVDIDPVISRVEKSIKDASATGVKINKLGKKPLSYKIAKHNEGEYVLFNFEAGGEAVGAVSKRLKLEQEAILRYLVVKIKVSRVPKVPKVSKEIGKQERREKVKSKVTVQTVSSREKKTEITKVKTRGPKQVKEKKQKVTKKGKKK